MMRAYFKRLAELSRTVGAGMVAASFIAYFIQPEGFKLLAAIILSLSGLAMWHAGVFAEIHQEGDQ